MARPPQPPNQSQQPPNQSQPPSTSSQPPPNYTNFQPEDTNSINHPLFLHQNDHPELKSFLDWRTTAHGGAQ